MSPNVNVRNRPGFGIREFDHVDISDRVGSTNNINIAVYKRGGASGQIVGRLQFTYIGGTPSANDAEIATVTRIA